MQGGVRVAAQHALVRVQRNARFESKNFGMVEKIAPLGVRYARAHGDRYLLGSAVRRPDGKWAPFGSISALSLSAADTAVHQVPFPPETPLFDSDHDAAVYAISAVARYSLEHPGPLEK